MHFAVIAPPFSSHIRALEAVASELMQLGHRVSWLHQADVASSIRLPGVAFHALGADSHPAGSLDALIQRAAHPGGPMGLRRVIRDVADATDMLCREAPALLQTLGVDAILADQMEAAGGLLAQGLGIPFVSVACALPVNRDPRVPLPVMPWGYAVDKRGEQLNEGSTLVYDWLMRPHQTVIEKHAAHFGLADKHTLSDCLSPLAQVSQTTARFDFVRAAEPHFHHAGPLRLPLASEPASQAGDVDAATGGRLDPSKPFVFASLGTLQGWRLPLFKRIARACRAEGAQVLIAHCDRLDAAAERTLLQCGATAVTGFAPQRATLARAQAVVTHAGLNTVLDALEAGTPQLALPIAFDQPGVAARVAFAGTGLKLLAPLASEKAIRRGLRRLLDEPGFKAASVDLGRDIPGAGGAPLAARIAVAAATTGRPVLRGDAAVVGGV